MKEKALRVTQIGSIHEMGELERAQELRVEGFSVQKLRESHETIQRLTPQVQELPERMNYLNDSGEFHEVESNFSSDQFRLLGEKPPDNRREVSAVHPQVQHVQSCTV